MGARIFTNFGPIYSLIERGVVRTGRDIKPRLDQAGVEGLEINGTVFELPDRLGFDLVAEDFEDLPLSLHSNHVDCNLGSINGFVRRAGVEQIRNELDLAAGWRMNPLTIHPGWVKKTDRGHAMSLFLDSLDRVLAGTPPATPTICLENMDDKPEKLCNLESEIQETLDRFPLLGLTVDFAHLGLRRADIGAFLKVFGDRIAHIHVSGVVPGRSHSRVSLRESTVELEAYVAAFRDRDITIVIENSSWETMMMSREVLDRWLR